MTKLLEPIIQFDWTLERYHDAIRKGVFTKADRVELIYGKIVKLLPVGSPHNFCVYLIADFFRERFGRDYMYWEEKTVILADSVSEPRPDVSVVVKKDYSAGDPTEKDTFLIVEVSSSSLRKDQTVKVALYAEAKIQEYWIVNLLKRRIEVHLDPLPDEGTYGSINNYAEGTTFNSPFAGEVVVAELLPAAEA